MRPGGFRRGASRSILLLAEHVDTTREFRRTRGSQPLAERERGGSLPRSCVFECRLQARRGGQVDRARRDSSLIALVPRRSVVFLAGFAICCTARNFWLICFGNLSRFPEELADAASGSRAAASSVTGSYAGDPDEAIPMPPVRWCSTPSPISVSPGLTSRPSPIVEFLGIKPEMRREGAQFWCAFSERRPRILIALLDAA